MERRYNLAGVSVQIAMPVDNPMDPRVTICLLDTYRALSDKGIPLEVKMEMGGSIIEQSRSLCAHNFLQSECTHLFWVDSDVTWKADDFIKILALATQLECVGAVYPIKEDPIRFFLHAEPDLTLTEHGTFSIYGMGLGFCCVQRKVMQQLAHKAPKVKMYAREGLVPLTFRCDIKDGHFRGEDHAFFNDVRDLGYQVHLEPSIQLGHVGPKEFKGLLQTKETA